MLLVALVSPIAVGQASPDAQSAQEARGQAVFLGRDHGHCILCHQLRQLDEPFQGNIGPDLSDVAMRMSEQQLRAQIADPTRSNPDSTMPGYFRRHGLVQVATKFRNLSVLTENQFEDLLVFLKTLKEEGR